MQIQIPITAFDVPKFLKGETVRAVKANQGTYIIVDPAEVELKPYSVSDLEVRLIKPLKR